MRSYKDVITRDFGKVKGIRVYPLADVHLGAVESEMGAFSKLIERIATEEDSYIILMGDLLDNGLKNSVTNVYRATMPPSQQKRVMAEMLRCVRDKLLAILPGNHERRSGKETDDDPAYDIASKLDLEDIYREEMALLRLSVGRQNGSGHYRPYTYQLAAVHGAGGGMYPGATVNKSANFLSSMDGIDVLLSAHAHKPYALRDSKLVVDVRLGLAFQRPTLSMCAGSWLSYGGYPVLKQMRPVAMPCASPLYLSGTEFDFWAKV